MAMNLEEQNKFLIKENQRLEALLAPKEFQVPQNWNLMRSEKRLLASLYSAPQRFRTHEELRTASCLGFTNVEIVKVRVSTMRKKLSQFGIEIKTVWGEGYELTPESKRIIKRAIEKCA